ncbi:MAG: carboxylate-amine ligase [Candidatus Longimicrobiales bacterium M2_2A_002]
MRLRLFQGYGVELEYMIVDAASMATRPIADRLLVDDTGTVQSEVDHGPISWSNELVSHVIELKTTEPAPSLDGLEVRFADAVAEVNFRLAPLGCTLLGTGAHPFFDPAAETVIWPGEYTEVYRTYDRIFGVRGHGWSNLQSVHLNLPFGDDVEFGRLHAAIRLVLPLIPALAASTPYLDGRRSRYMDARLHVYRHNQDPIPELVGRVVPEAVFSEADYEARIFASVQAALAPHDPDRVLGKYFANSRGAIARFDRGSIEIRVIDLQEHPGADLAVVALLVAVIRALVDERWSTHADQRAWNEARLVRVLDACIADGEAARIDDVAYLRVLGLDADAGFAESASAGDVWAGLRDGVGNALSPAHATAIDHILRHGTLARRLVDALGDAPDRDRLRRVYAGLAGCLREGRPFTALPPGA